MNMENKLSLKLSLTSLWTSVLDAIDFSLCARSLAENWREVCVISHCRSPRLAISSIGKHSRFKRGIFQITGPCALINKGYMKCGNLSTSIGPAMGATTSTYEDVLSIRELRRGCGTGAGK